ncbi:10862_t:CDS:1 [Racocetra fulgida]|uniref:10862_t:CDS:1 n=1 Tax=Racocetra fulgida TaxID=60492 RepID=A0A9N8VQU5_9GLOM|nr:10862_t:CDS:1 [Racocetra fulgida]
MPNRPLGPFPTPETYHPVIQGLINMIKRNDWESKFEKAVSDAHNTDVEDMTTIVTLNDYYNYLHYLLMWVPREDETGSLIYNMLCTMYFVLDQESVQSLQSPVKPSSYPPEPLSELSQWIIYFSCAMGQFLNTPQSLTEESLKTFYMSDKYNMNIYEAPRDGWRCFNDFFARKLLPGVRPIDGPSDPRVIVSAADSTFDGWWNIDENSIVTLKGIPWTIRELLADSKYSNEFAGGKFMHAYLSPSDYHRQHAPIDGTVLEAKVIPGQAYLEVNVKKDSRNKLVLKPGRGIGTDKPKADIDTPDSPGYQFCQARGLFIIQSPKIGYVAVLPIGMCQVSSVILTKKEGDEIKKGDEISYFQFGGSDVVLLFQKNVQITAEINQHYNVGQTIAIAKISD